MAFKGGLHIFAGTQTERGELKILENCDELAVALAEYIADLSEHYWKERRVFAIALSDGSLIGLLGKLCELPFTKTVEWGIWHIFWADEHVVSRTHFESNFRIARDGFLDKVPIRSSHVHPVNDRVSAEEAANQYEFLIRQSVKIRTIDVSDFSDNPKFDLILLGMGPDGHIASLFPNHPLLDSTNTDWVSYLIDSPESPPARVTFTLPVINAAANVAIVATGEAKAEAVHLAIDNMEPDIPSLPARMVQPAQGKLVWFLDKPAASKLTIIDPNPPKPYDNDPRSDGSSIFP